MTNPEIDPETGETIEPTQHLVILNNIPLNHEVTMIVQWVAADRETGQIVQVLDAHDAPLPDGTSAIEQVTVINSNTGEIVKEYNQLLVVPDAPLNDNDVDAIGGCWQQPCA